MSRLRNISQLTAIFNFKKVASLVRDQELFEKVEKEFSFSRFENLDTLLESTISNLKYLQAYVKKAKVKYFFFKMIPFVNFAGRKFGKV